jgi:hypothetical protein
MPDSGTFDYWYFDELTHNPPDGLWTGAMDHWLVGELPEIYADLGPRPPVSIGWGQILLVNTGTWAAPVFEPLAEQRVVDFGEGSEPIDWSSKDSRFRRIMPGRYSSDVSAGGLYVPGDPPYLALQGAMRGHELILIRRCEDGVPIEDAIALVKAISIDAPDNDVGLMAVGLVVDGWWFPAVP